MQKNKLPSFVSVLVLTLLTSIIWISFGVYRAFTTKPAPSVPKNISDPLTPTLDTASLTQIESRVFFSDSQIPEISITQTSTAIPSAKPTTTPVATSSGTPIETPTAAPSPTP